MSATIPLRTAWAATGKVDYGRKASEEANLQFRRSLYYVKALRKGEQITADAVRSVRPGFGMAPKHLDDVVGRTVSVDVSANTPVLREQLG